MTKKEIQDYKDKRNLKYGFNAYWNKGFDEAITLLNKQEVAIDYTRSSLQLLCVDSKEYSGITIGEKYKIIDEGNLLYLIENDAGFREFYSKKYFKKQ